MARDAGGLMTVRARQVLVVVTLALASCVFGQEPGTAVTGIAVVYSNKLHGHVTASGQLYDKTKLTAAHKTLPFGTKIKVTNLKNHRSVTLTVNDRGPFQKTRMLDISPAAAALLGFRSMREVSLEVVQIGDGKTHVPARTKSKATAKAKSI